MTLKFPRCFNVTQAFPLSYLTAKGTKTQKTETQSPWRPLKGRGRLKAWMQTSLITYVRSQLSVPQRRHSDMENNTYQSNHELQLAFECAYGKSREIRFRFSFGNHYREWLCAGHRTELPGGNRKITEGTTQGWSAYQTYVQSPVPSLETIVVHYSYEVRSSKSASIVIQCA